MPMKTGKAGRVGPLVIKDKEKRSECKGMDIGRFFSFAQCSVKMETKHFLGEDLELKDPTAKRMWPHFEKLALRNLGKNEKWVPFHTVLGVHEKFVVEKIHHADEKQWDAYRRFVLMFIFRSHCKVELFEEVQRQHFKKESFWKNPSAAFEKGSPMHKDIKQYRAKGNSLQTSCFLIIPERLVKNDNDNIVINLLLRTQRLINLAEKLWPVVHDKNTSTSQKYATIQEKIEACRGLGETWVKMLMVVIDIAMPDLGLLHDCCPVGNGASDPLRKILEGEGILQPKEKKEAAEKSQRSDNFEVFGPVGSNFEIVKVAKKGKQLLQVTKGVAGSLDRAHAICTILCKMARKGASIGQLIKKKHDLIGKKGLKIPKLGLDAEAKKMLKAKAAHVKVDRSKEPSPAEGLVQLRERIVKEYKGRNRKLFWNLLRKAEDKFTKRYSSKKLITKQMMVSKKGLSCGTLQVQLCEFRQFNNALSK